MNTDRTRTGLTFPSGRMERHRQREVVRAAGASHIVDVDTSEGFDWRKIAEGVRAGDTLYIVALVLVPTPRRRGDSDPIAQAGQFVSDVVARGGVIVECLTGLRSDNHVQRRRMIAEATWGIKGGGRQFPRGSTERGRPSANCDAVREQARAIWKSRDYATNAAALAHMPHCTDRRTGKPIPWTLAKAYSEFKASGRPFKRRRSKS